MTLPNPVMLKGGPLSPYTRKMVAVLRYRRIPYSLLYGAADEAMGLPKANVPLWPTFYLPDAHGKLAAVTDSTPLIRYFESEVTGRSVIPGDPVIAFVDSLIEDYADECLTKALMHYRWHYAADGAQARGILMMHNFGASLAEAQVESLSQEFARRQIGRLPVVGSNPTTAQAIEEGYHRILELLDAHLQKHPFLMGRRPGASDFGIYGQLTQLAQFDPTPMAVAYAKSRRTIAWVGMMDDLSGLTPASDGWTDRDTVPQTLLNILSEAGRVYVPLMLANARALNAGSAEVDALIDGHRWRLQPIKYQGKCLQNLRAEFARLGAGDQATARSLLQKAGCMPLIDASI
jgi:glutathione S-transferase